MPVIEFIAMIKLVLLIVLASWVIDKTENLTAAHELGHALVCQYYGIPVHKVRLLQYGTGGYTTFEFPTDVNQHTVIIAAGYVAEEQARGHPITGALRGGQYEGDSCIMRELIGNDRAAEAIAIERAAAILAIEDIAKCIRELIPVLVDEGEISGSRIHYHR